MKSRSRVNAADKTGLQSLEPGVNAGPNTANAGTPVNGRADNGYVKFLRPSFTV
jgi:hypothetical protein